MATIMKIPAVGESISEVTISQWFKKTGEYVEMDEVICELESDKATFELNAEVAGILTTKADEGDTIAIGEIVCEIAEQANSSAMSAAKTEPSPVAFVQASSDTGKVLEMVVPALGESITEVTIGEWLKEDGAFVALDEEICEVETDKATQALPAEAQGILKIVAQTGDTLEVGALICKIEVMADAAGAKTQEPKDVVSESPSTVSQGTNYATGHASPAAAKILAEKGIDLSWVQPRKFGTSQIP